MLFNFFRCLNLIAICLFVIIILNLKSFVIFSVLQLYVKYILILKLITWLMYWYCTLKVKILNLVYAIALPFSIILNLRKLFTDCFQNLAQCFIGIQEYVNDIVLKKKVMGPPGGRLNLKIPKVFYRFFLHFRKNFHSNTEVFL